MSNIIMDTNIKTLLLHIFIILLLYCVMYTFIYNDKVLKFDDDDNNFNDNLNDNLKNNKDKFINILNTEGDQYINTLNNLSSSVSNMRVNDIKPITDIINNIKQNQSNNNKKIIDSLTEIYFKRCLEYVNKKNAVVYNEFLKYDKPAENKYYQQFL